MNIKASQFVSALDRRVLTDDGEQGMDGVAGRGSSTEHHQGQIAVAIFKHAEWLDDRQLDQVIEWVNLYKRKPLDDDHFMKLRPTD